MGVVRDVTIDNLTQAVQGISSTGISDSTGQAINNTLGTLGKDTSLQGIISAITGLGQTLGNDKANIDGSNLANPSAWRSAINALYDIYLQSFIAPTSGTNLNTLVSNVISLYQIGNITQYGNSPSGKGTTGLLIVFKVDTYVIQLWLSNTTISHRASYNNGGTWSNWL